jgi:2-keto-4-pentenoate hydratase/2-oxohepta-3-ene-1,7-dioic acid hydratase in catechol pathway
MKKYKLFDQEVLFRYLFGPGKKKREEVSMRIVRFLSAAGPRLGLLRKDQCVIDLPAAADTCHMNWLRPLFTDLRAFVMGGTNLWKVAEDLALQARRSVPLDTVQLLAPFESGAKILAHVVNYAEHGAEANLKAPEKPFFFYKPGSSVTNPGDPIVAHAVSKRLDHEVELAVVIGRRAVNVAESDVYDYVAGYTIANDVSFRDLQTNADVPSLTPRYGQNWTQGKGLDGACPLGPVVVLSDEMPRPYPLDITCRVNGEVRQHSNTEHMIFKVPQLIADISRSMTLNPGDLVLTGTCSGGGVGTGKYLVPGDVVECEIEKLGVLRNTVVTGV